MPFSVAQLCEWTGGKLANADSLGLAGRSVDAISVSRLAPLGVSGPEDCAFFFSREYEAEVLTARCGVLITGEPFFRAMRARGIPLQGHAAILVCADPYLAMARLSERFARGFSTVAHLPSGEAAETPGGGLVGEAGVSGLGSAVPAEVHATASVHPTAVLGRGVRIGSGCVIEAGAEIGEGSVLYPGCFVGPGARIGKDCVLFPNVVLYEWVEIGDRVRIHAGSVVGSDGFGYAPLRQAETGVCGHQKIFHLGRVRIGDDVELGANVTVDRGTLADTRIERMAKLDNQVHIGHNSLVEEGAIICGGTCLAGGAVVGRYATVGGLTGVSNRVRVGAGAQVGAMTLVTKDVADGETAVGSPQRSYREHFKAHAALNRLVAARGKPGGAPVVSDSAPVRPAGQQTGQQSGQQMGQVQEEGDRG
jgi:UDP-3-O-[3-hydroxymyristoyl] glucosamine N-acyltransferase